MDYGSNSYHLSDSTINDLFGEIPQPHLVEYFHEKTLKEIPILQAMGISFENYKQGTMRVNMPLAPNINDKNTGFGGSIVTLATITGWSLLSLMLNQEEKHFEVVIMESAIQYSAPVTGDCHAVAKLTHGETLCLSQDLITRGKARINIVVNIYVDEKHTASFEGKYHIRPIVRSQSKLKALSQLVLE